MPHIYDNLHKNVYVYAWTLIAENMFLKIFYREQIQCTM